MYMRTSYFFAFIVSTLIASAAFAQAYVPFADSNAVWSLQWDDLVGPPNPFGKHYGMHGDTVIGSNTYHKMYVGSLSSGGVHTPTTYAGAIREQNKQIFWIGSPDPAAPSGTYWVNYSPSQEVMLYDFNAVLGDTVTVDTFDFVVTSVGSITVGSGARRTLDVQSVQKSQFNTNIYATWIEGLGSSYGPAEYTENIFDYQWTLQCYKDDNVNHAFCQCACHTVGVPEVQNAVKVIVSPNPSASEFDVSWKSTVVTNVKVIDAVGRLVEAKTITGSQRAMLGRSLPVGTYWIELRDEDGKRVAVEKVIKR